MTTIALPLTTVVAMSDPGPVDDPDPRVGDHGHARRRMQQASVLRLVERALT
jgi:hypothetical protein